MVEKLTTAQKKVIKRLKAGEKLIYDRTWTQPGGNDNRYVFPESGDTVKKETVRALERLGLVRQDIQPSKDELGYGYHFREYPIRLKA